MLNTILFLLGAGVMFFMAARAALQRRRLCEKGEKVQARIAGRIQTRQGAAYALEFDTPGGSHRLSYPTTAKGGGFTVGQTVTLYYDPDDPERMYVEGDRAVLGAEALYWLLGAILLVLLVCLAVL